MASFKKQLKAHLNAAEGYAKLSYAKRLKVGAVLVKDGRIVSVGYNGRVSGVDNECEMDHPEIMGLKITRPDVVHAEMNVIAFAAKNGVSTNECELVITHSPCYECCKLIIQSGIKGVYFKDKYRDVSGLKFLNDSNITTEEI